MATRDQNSPQRAFDVLGTDYLGEDVAMAIAEAILASETLTVKDFDDAIEDPVDRRASRPMSQIVAGSVFGHPEPVARAVIPVPASPVVTQARLVSQGALVTAGLAVIFLLALTGSVGVTVLADQSDASPLEPDPSSEVTVGGISTLAPSPVSLAPPSAGIIPADDSTTTAPVASTTTSQATTSTTAASTTTSAPTTAAPTTAAPTTAAPTTAAPTTRPPTTAAPTTRPPTTRPPTTRSPTTRPPTTSAPTTQVTIPDITFVQPTWQGTDG